jgi:hypothetical protein
MKTGAEIVADIEANLRSDGLAFLASVIRQNWPTIRAALLSYEPKSALRMILDRTVHHDASETFINVTEDELAAARVELDRLERETKP